MQQQAIHEVLPAGPTLDPKRGDWVEYKTGWGTEEGEVIDAVAGLVLVRPDGKRGANADVWRSAGHVTKILRGAG